MKEIQFDYDAYLISNCLVPLFFLIFVLIAFTILIVGYVRYFRDGTSDKSLDVILKMILGFVVLLFLMSTKIMLLSRGGIYLLFEKENDAIEITGEIESTFELPFNGGMRLSKYGIRQNDGCGEGIIIDGIKYHIMTYGDYKEGDMVTIKVLPKSKLVLELAPAELAE